MNILDITFNRDNNTVEGVVEYDGYEIGFELSALLTVDEFLEELRMISNDHNN